MPDYKTIADTVGNTPLVKIQRLLSDSTTIILGKLEGNNPAGSVKDRPAMSMIQQAERRGDIVPGDTLIEATSGNTGIALAMTAAIMGYRMRLIMPDNATMERRAAMYAYGAELHLVSKEDGMEGARDLALAMQARGEGKVLNHRFKKQWLKCDFAEVMTAPVDLWFSLSPRSLSMQRLFS